MFLTCKAAAGVFISLLSVQVLWLGGGVLWFPSLLYGSILVSFLIVSPYFSTRVCSVTRLSKETIQEEAITFRTAAARLLLSREQGRRGELVDFQMLKSNNSKYHKTQFLPSPEKKRKSEMLFFHVHMTDWSLSQDRSGFLLCGIEIALGPVCSTFAFHTQAQSNWFVLLTLQLELGKCGLIKGFKYT